MKIDICLNLPIVISVHLHLAHVDPVVTEDSSLVNVRRRLLSLEPALGLLIVSPEMSRTEVSAVTELRRGISS